MDKNNLRFPEEKVLSISKTTLAVARENITELEKFGINEAFLNTFEAEINEAEALFDENKEKHDLKILTQTKNEALEACYQWNNNVKLRIELAFGNSSKEYVSFPSKLLAAARSSEQRMMPVMESVISIATKAASSLSAFGQTPEILNEGNLLLEKLRHADNVQELKKIHKKEATQIRRKIFNASYAKVNTINKVGRNIFKDRPEKYVLFESPWGSHSNNSVKTYKAEINAETSIIIAEELDLDLLIYLENTGTTELNFFTGEKMAENIGVDLSPGEEATLNLNEIGNGNSLSVENTSHNKMGSYLVKI